MKLIGIIGGLSPYSTVSYYEALNRCARERVGGRHSARCLIHSVDFGVTLEKHRARDWPGVTQQLVEAARSLERGGADSVLLACNTLHHVADRIAAAIDVPFLHIGDALAEGIDAAGWERAGLLGTRFTMEAKFLRGRLESHGVEVLVPDREFRNRFHSVLYDEVCDGRVPDGSEDILSEAAGDFANAGAQGVVLACTEIGLMLREGDYALPVLDCVALHASLASRHAMK